MMKPATHNVGPLFSMLIPGYSEPVIVLLCGYSRSVLVIMLPAHCSFFHCFILSIITWIVPDETVFQFVLEMCNGAGSTTTVYSMFVLHPALT